MAHISFKLNGKAHLVDVDPECPLLYVLRDNAGLNNPRFGCGPAIAEAAARSLPTWGGLGQLKSGKLTLGSTCGTMASKRSPMIWPA